MDVRERYLDESRRLNGHTPAWLAPMRKDAIALFAELGFPTPRLEDWKYTNVAPLSDTFFECAVRPGAAGPEILKTIDSLSIESSIELVFIDGQLVFERRQPGGLPSGVCVAGLASCLDAERGLLEPHLGRIAGRQANSFTALNTAFLSDGAFVYLPRNQILEKPVHLLYLASSTGPPTVSHPRNLIVAEEGSRAMVVESYVGSGERIYFTNAVTEVVVGPNASVQHCKAQMEGESAFHIGTVEARQERDSRFHSISLSVGGSLVRNDINAVLGAPGGRCSFDGLYLGGGHQHVDHHTSIDHREPHCSSEQLYKGVMDGHATAVFNGKIFVRPDAQKSDARQANNNLLLSEDSVVNTKPQLEIFADDVKCSHGATIGRLEEDALFYLRSRGIDEVAARSILINGFANEVLDRVGDESLRARFEGMVRSRFHDPRESEGPCRTGV